jgi:hypothetical protein
MMLNVESTLGRLKIDDQHARQRRVNYHFIDLMAKETSVTVQVQVEDNCDLVELIDYKEKRFLRRSIF